MATIRRAAAAVVALLLALVLGAAPAHASQDATKCASYDGDRQICLVTTWKDQVGATGITVYEIRVELRNPLGTMGNLFETPLGFDCDALRMWVEPSDTIKWRKDGNACDVSYNQRTFQINFPDGISMPNANQVAVSLAGWPKFNNAPDPGRVVITQNLYA